MGSYQRDDFLAFIQRVLVRHTSRTPAASTPDSRFDIPSLPTPRRLVVDPSDASKRPPSSLAGQGLHPPGARAQDPDVTNARQLRHAIAAPYDPRRGANPARDLSSTTWEDRAFSTPLAKSGEMTSAPPVALRDWSWRRGETT